MNKTTLGGAVLTACAIALGTVIANLILDHLKQRRAAAAREG